MADAALDLRSAMGVPPIDPDVVAKLEAERNAEQPRPRPVASEQAAEVTPEPVVAVDPVPSQAEQQAVQQAESTEQIDPPPVSIPTIPPQLQTPFVLAVAKDGGLASAEWAARFEGWLRGQNLTLTTAKPAAAEEFLTATGRDGFRYNAVRRMLKLAEAAGVPMTPQALGEHPNTATAAKRRATAAERVHHPVLPTVPAGSPVVSVGSPLVSVVAPAAPQVPQGAPVAEQPAAFGPPTAQHPTRGRQSPAGVYVPRYVEVELASDGVTMQGVAVGTRVGIATYPGEQVANAGSMSVFAQEQVLPGLPWLRPGSVANFYFCELSDRRVKTGREWHVPVLVRGAAGHPTAFGYGPPQGYGAPAYGNPYGIPMTQQAPQMNPVEQAAGTAYVDLMKKSLDDLFSKQIASAKAAAGGDPNVLYQLQRDIDRRYDEMLRAIQEEARRRDAATSSPIPISIPAAHEDDSEKLLAKLLDKAFDKDKDSPTLRALEILQKLQPPQPQGTSSEVADLKAQIAEMRADAKQKEREDKLRDEISKLSTKIAEMNGANSGNLPGGLQGLGHQLRAVREIAEDTGMVGGDDPEDDLLKLAMKNPAGTAQLIGTMLAPFMPKPQPPAPAPAASLPVAPPPVAQAPTAPTSAPTAPPVAAATSPVEQAPTEAPPPPPPDAAVKAAAQIVEIAAEPDEEDGFSEEKENQIGMLALAALQAWAGSPEPAHQQRAAAYIGWLKVARSFPDLYQIVKAIVGDSLGQVPKHRVIANVATVLHMNWDMVSSHLFGKATELEDADEYDEDEDAA